MITNAQIHIEGRKKDTFTFHNILSFLHEIPANVKKYYEK